MSGIQRCKSASVIRRIDNYTGIVCSGEIQQLVEKRPIIVVVMTPPPDVFDTRRGHPPTRLSSTRLGRVCYSVFVAADDAKQQTSPFCFVGYMKRASGNLERSSGIMFKSGYCIGTLYGILIHRLEPCLHVTRSGRGHPSSPKYA
jgi:hypothetical protein